VAVGGALLVRVLLDQRLRLLEALAVHVADGNGIVDVGAEVVLALAAEADEADVVALIGGARDRQGGVGQQRQGNGGGAGAQQEGAAGGHDSLTSVGGSFWDCRQSRHRKQGARLSALTPAPPRSARYGRPRTRRRGGRRDPPRRTEPCWCDH